MRVDRLKVPDFRNLKGFEIDFDESQPTTVILGRNGSGKSNLIEALIEIFRDLEEEKVSRFTYEISYLCHGHRIEVSNDPKSKRHQQHMIDSVSISRAEFTARHDEVLPKHVFAYYSGWNRRLESGFDDPTRKLYKQWLNNEDRDIPLRRLFYCRKEYSQLVLLAFFLSHSDSAKKLLRDYLEIEVLDSALFILKKPYWRESKKPTPFERRTGDERFWFARGAFKHFLDRLWENALAPILTEEPVPRDIRRPSQSTERLYLYIKSVEQLHTLSGSDSPKEFFGLLESLFLCDLIDEVRVTVRHSRAGRIRFEQLSEGEQQLLTVLGLLLFTQNDESLYLLDEPDTHLNPVWTYDFLKLLQENISAEKGQLIVSTHNPLMIGSLHKNQVRVLTRTDDGISAVEPEYDPIGIGVEGLLKSELYGLRSTLAPEVLKDIDTQNRLLALKGRTTNQDEELREATERLAELGVMRSHPNPLFDLFARAIATQPIFQKPVLSKEDIENQEKLANEILDDILREAK